MKKILLSLLIMTLSMIGFSQVHKTKVVANAKIGSIDLKLKESVTNEDYKTVSRRILLTFKTGSCDCPGVREGDTNYVLLTDTSMVHWFIYDLEQSIYTLEKRSNTTDSWYRSEFFGLKTNNLNDSIVFSSSENITIEPFTLMSEDGDFEAFVKNKPIPGSMIFAYFNDDAYEINAGEYFDIFGIKYVVNDSSKLTAVVNDSVSDPYPANEKITIELVNGVTQISIEDAKQIIAWLRKNKIYAN